MSLLIIWYIHIILLIGANVIGVDNKNDTLWIIFNVSGWIIACLELIQNIRGVIRIISSYNANLRFCFHPFKFDPIHFALAGGFDFTVKFIGLIKQNHIPKQAVDFIFSIYYNKNNKYR